MATEIARAGDAPPRIPQGVLPQVRLGDAGIADIEPLQQLQDADAADGGDEQDHGDDRPPVEVGDAAQHLVVEEGGDDLIAAAHRGGDARSR